MGETINHPSHYGGDTPYEAIKVIEAWELGFNLGNTVKYISRADKKNNRLEDLKKAAWYLNREIENAESQTAKSSTVISGRLPILANPAAPFHDQSNT